MVIVLSPLLHWQCGNSLVPIIVIALQHENVVENIEHKYLEEVASTHQNFKEMCRVTRHRMSSEIVDKMRRLQEETVVSELNFGKVDLNCL